MRDETIKQLGVHLIWVPLVPPVLAVCLDIDVSAVGNSIFSTLAGIQASIFAIVFSVVILGVQLSTSQYSPRLSTLFRSDEVYFRTVGIFAVAISWSVLGLFAIGYGGGFWLETWLFVAGILALVAAVSLFDFVDRTLEQTTPEGILRRLEDDLQPENIIEKAQRADEEKSKPDPFLVPLSVINSQVDARDTAAVYLGLEIISQNIQALLARDSKELFQEDTPVGDSLEDLLTERLINTAVNAVSKNMEEAANELVRTIENIGDSGVAHSLDRPVILVSRAFSQVVFSLNFEEVDERVRKNAIGSANDVLQNAAAAGLWEATGKGTRYLGWKMANSVYARDKNQNNGVYYSGAVMSYFPGIIDELVDSVADSIDDQNVDWESPHPNPKTVPYPRSRALQAPLVAVSELTSAIIQFELNNNVKLADWGYVAHGWTRAISNLSNVGLDSLQQVWIGSTLYLQYLSEQAPSEVMDNFDPLVQQKVSDDTLVAVIDNILSDDLDPTQWLGFRQTVNPVVNPQTGYQFDFDIECDDSFKEWLIRNRVYWR